MGCKGEAKRPRLNVYLNDDHYKKLLFIAGAWGMAGVSTAIKLLEPQIDNAYNNILKEIKES